MLKYERYYLIKALHCYRLNTPRHHQKRFIVQAIKLSHCISRPEIFYGKDERRANRAAERGRENESNAEKEMGGEVVSMFDTRKICCAITLIFL